MTSGCCMRLNLLLGSARKCPGSTCISPVWLARCPTLSLSLHPYTARTFLNPQAQGSPDLGAFSPCSRVHGQGKVVLAIRLSVRAFIQTALGGKIRVNRDSRTTIRDYHSITSVLPFEVNWQVSSTTACGLSHRQT